MTLGERFGKSGRAGEKPPRPDPSDTQGIDASDAG
jgi:hypothetical protein